MKRLHRTALRIVLVGLAGCQDGPAEESPQARFARVAAHRQACASHELAERADENLAVLAALAEEVETGDAAAEIRRRATAAAFAFSQAYQRHAELRASAYAQMDSALNHARTPADSLRYRQRALSFAVRPPEEGTVEANVYSSYLQDLTAILDDPSHRCNWDLPF